MKYASVLIAILILFAGAAFAGDMTVQELHDRLTKGEDVFLIDVREAWEHEEFNLGGKLIPVGRFPDAIKEL